jgi:hypothetical protein
MALAAWSIDGVTQPKRLDVGGIELEKSLESWIEADPGLIEAGLAVVGRQVKVDGGWLDLLCVDQQGRPTVVEIKKGKLIRDVIAQAIDYASSIASMSEPALRTAIESYAKPIPTDHPGVSALLESDAADERDVAIVVVGVGQEPGLDRMIDFLRTKFGMPLRAVTFDVFAFGDGSKILVREEMQPDAASKSVTVGSTIDSVVERAGGKDSPNGRRMRVIAEAAQKNGLHIKPYKWSLMLAPPQNKNRYLANLWRWSHKNELAISFSADAFAEFFPVTAAEVRDVLGPDDAKHYAVLDDEAARQWTTRLDELFRRINAVSESEGSDGATQSGAAAGGDLPARG